MVVGPALQPLSVPVDTHEYCVIIKMEAHSCDPDLERLRQGDGKFKANLVSIVRSCLNYENGLESDVLRQNLCSSVFRKGMCGVCVCTCVYVCMWYNLPVEARG